MNNQFTFNFRTSFYSIFLFSFCLFSCQKEASIPNKTKTHFKNVSPEHSGIHFSNDIVENDTLNYFTFPYLYMGGGVAIGDINNDGLSDIFVTGNMTPNKLYINQGDLKFKDFSEQAGVSGDQAWYTGVTMADVNSDGWLDIYLCVSGQHPPFKNQLYINQKNNTFKEKAEQYGIADASTSIQSSFFDYDLDGDLDLLVGNYPQILVSQGNEFYSRKMQANLPEESAHLYQNNGNGTFSDVTQQAGIQNFGLTLGIATVDFNEDGYPDIYLSNDFNVPDYFYINNGDGTFSESIQASTRHTSMFGMGVDAADFNNDGLLDFGQVDMTPEDYKRSKTNMASMSPASFQQAVDIGFHYQYMQNSIQLNQGIDPQGAPIFSDVARMTGMATTDWSWGIQFMDLDNDGWQDVFISNGMKRDVNNNDVNAAYEFSSTFGDPTQRDINTLPSEPISNYAFKNEGNLSFSKATKDWGLAKEGFTNGFAYGDLDNDGDLDLVLNNLDAKLGVFENESTANNYLQIQFKGSNKNPFGIGTKVRLQANGKQQYQELNLTKGFQSSVAPILHFGLGEEIEVSQLEVIWSDGRTQILSNIAANQRLTINYQDAQTPSTQIPQKITEFKEITTLTSINFKHTEDEYDDYEREILLPHKNSQFGPALAVGDVNGDGLEDFFVGNAANATAKLYIQQTDGTFQAESEPWSADAQYEDTGAHFFDADQDGDLDLYVVNGGNAPNRPDDYYQDRLYINTPNGFKHLKTALPKMPTSGQVVTSNDFDGDGHLDLFVGGRIIPSQYPLAASSYLLKNMGGKDEHLRFEEVTVELAPNLNKLGLVTTAIWSDYDGDGSKDLMVAGEWMSIRFFKNKNGRLEETTTKLKGLENMEGWWYALKEVDVDLDGDMDYVAGNLGLNYKYHASEKAPFEVYANDFDENGQLDIVLSYKKKGVQLPVRGRECSSQQVPALAARFRTFEAFADADLNVLYGEQMLENSTHLEAKTFASYWIENKGNAQFERHILPALAQLSSINAIETIYYDDDELPDLLLFGNLYDSEVETPRNDASIGLVLQQNTDHTYTAIPSKESGVLLTGEAKVIAPVRLGKEQEEAFLIGMNDDFLKLIERE